MVEYIFYCVVFAGLGMALLIIVPAEAEVKAEKRQRKIEDGTWGYKSDKDFPDHYTKWPSP